MTRPKQLARVFWDGFSSMFTAYQIARMVVAVKLMRAQTLQESPVLYLAGVLVTFWAIGVLLPDRGKP